MVRCALTDEEIRADEAYWAPPLITVQQLVGTIFSTLLRDPSNLKHVLLAKQDDVAYSPAAREELAARRTAEQLKLLLALLVLLAVIVGIIWLITGSVFR
ncbi:MAG: hypothetical protein HC876_01355 [Chloroflexaceae bacterium]|nr:hypothetical protein [Chloroflexaceae bacterium]NJO04280.1 hypothetical protein [Chloroflexaceae bacterium]